MAHDGVRLQFKVTQACLRIATFPFCKHQPFSQFLAFLGRRCTRFGHWPFSLIRSSIDPVWSFVAVFSSWVIHQAKIEQVGPISCAEALEAIGSLELLRPMTGLVFNPAGCPRTLHAMLSG